MQIRRWLMKKKYMLLLVGLALLSFGCSNPFTPAGHEGFVFENPRMFGKGGFRGVIKGPWNYGASLWRNQAIIIDMRPKTYKEIFKVLAKDDLNVSFRFEAVIRIKKIAFKRLCRTMPGFIGTIDMFRNPFDHLSGTQHKNIQAVS